MAIRDWPQLAIQLYANHTMRNLLAKARVHLCEELAEDYRRMIYADGRAAVEQERVTFTRKRCLPACRRRATISSLLIPLYRLPDFAVEGAVDHQRAGAHQRRVLPANQDLGLAAQRRGGFVPELRLDHTAPPDRLARPNQ